MNLPTFATGPQRSLIISLLRKGDFDVRRISLMHTRIPHVGRQFVDYPVDGWLAGISTRQASDVIAWLKEEVS